MPPMPQIKPTTLLLLSTILASAASFQPPARRTPSTRPFSRAVLLAKRTYIYDGGEFLSFRTHNPTSSPPPPTPSEFGRVTFVTSPTRIGVAAPPSASEGASIGGEGVHPRTVASIPPGVSEGDAASTAAASLVGIHCAGGGTGEGFSGGKAVVVGGNEYACFIAEGLAVLGMDTTLVTTASVKIKNKNVKVMGPAVPTKNGDEIGFAAAIGQFDSLVDTIADERGGMPSADPSSSGAIRLLLSKHNCAKYISTLSKSQQIVKRDGVVFGPSKADAHVKSLESASLSACAPLVPAGDFGASTLQVLLDNGVIYPSKSSRPTVVRGWSVKELWEETSWPRRPDGSGARFGMPAPEEEEDPDEAPRGEGASPRRRAAAGRGEGGAAPEAPENPHVRRIAGAKGLSEEVVLRRKNAVVFVAMRSCRTCRGIDPAYTRMARERDGDVVFAKADATGKVGKELGRQLGVVSVPSFVLFRNGIRYGVVATSKLPSDRLDKAISLLEAGEDFDPSLEEEEEDQ